MSLQTAAERRRQAAQDAAEWMVRLQAPTLTAKDRADFVDWLRESPLHVAELLRADRIHWALSSYDQWQHITPAAAEESQATATVTSLRPSIELVAPATRSMHLASRLKSRPLLLAASILPLLALAGLWAMHGFGGTVFRTGIGERREVTLSDGSIITLAPASELHVKLTRRERDVMLDRGEALFHVSKDPSRPFVVSAADARVRAVGTAFSVERGSAAVVVTVIEGRVAVSETPLSATPPTSQTDMSASIAVGVDEQLAVFAKGSAGGVRKVNAQAKLAWAQGQLIFENDTVDEVVRQFNRQNRIQLRVLDARLGSRPVSGVFRVSDPQSFVAFLQAAGGVSSLQNSSGEILIGANGANPVAAL